MTRLEAIEEMKTVVDYIRCISILCPDVLASAERVMEFLGSATDEERFNDTIRDMLAKENAELRDCIVRIALKNA